MSDMYNDSRIIPKILSIGLFFIENRVGIDFIIKVKRYISDMYRSKTSGNLIDPSL